MFSYDPPTGPWPGTPPHAGVRCGRLHPAGIPVIRHSCFHSRNGYYRGDLLIACPAPDSATPEPTGTLPWYWSMNVQAMSNGQAINPQIIITFRGGMGMNLIPRIELKVTRSDGIVQTGEMNQPFATGQSVTFAATTGTDRAEAWAITPQGDAVKILDQVRAVPIV